VSFKTAVTQDVPDIQVVSELATNQDGAMTFQWVFLGTHQCQAKACDALSHALQSGAKCGCPGNPVITGDTFNVTLTLGTTRAEFVAKKNITDVYGTQCTIKNIAVVLGKAGAVRAAPHVADGFDAMLRQQFDKLFPRLSLIAPYFQAIFVKCQSKNNRFKNIRKPVLPHFSFCPRGKGAERGGQRNVQMCPEAMPLAAGFGDAGSPQQSKSG
jgi:hypothetical protein